MLNAERQFIRDAASDGNEPSGECGYSGEASPGKSVPNCRSGGAIARDS